MARNVMLDLDKGSAPVGHKRGEMIDIDQAVDREITRDGLVGLDKMTEASEGLNRLQKDAARVAPRDTTAPLGHPRKDRPLPGPDDTRTPLSSRQKKARSKARHQALATMPKSQIAAQQKITTDTHTWNTVNDALSDASGDVENLSEKDQQTARRVDRSIQQYEKLNDRGHRVYANVEMPAHINRSNIDTFLDNHVSSGDTVHFDRFTMGAHQLHEIEKPDPGGRTVAFEIHTRRGAYTGMSDGGDDTGHLLPRGMQFVIAGTHQATYTRPDGTTGTRRIIQLIDTTPDTTQE